MPTWIQVVGTFLLVISQIVCVPGRVQITHGPKSQRKAAGRNLFLECQAMGPQPPTIEWYRDNSSKPIESVKGSRIRINKETNALTIRNLTTQDTGNYTCRASQGSEVATKVAQVIVEDVPDPPTNVQLKECDNRIAEIGWTPASENNSPVRQFVIEYNTSFSPHVWQRAKSGLSRLTRSHRITVSPWANYTFRVIAQNDIGWSRPSVPTQSVCEMPPDVPRHNPRRVCTLNEKANELVIAWRAMPREDHNGPGFRYVVEYRKDEGKQSEKHDHVVDASQSQISIGNQPKYTLYEIYVYAVNNMGKASLPPQQFEGYSSEDVPKEIVRDFRLDPEKPLTNITADFLWTHVNVAPWTISGFFRGYKIEFWKTKEGLSSKRVHNIIMQEPNDCWRFGVDALKRPERGSEKTSVVSTLKEVRSHIYNLWPYTDITAQIRVLNAKYEGPPSQPLTFRTAEGVPGPVENLKINGRDSSKFEISWSKPSQPNGVIIGYVIHYRVISPQILDMKKTIITDPGITQKKLTQLLPNRTYQVFVWAESKIGLGQSEEVQGTTLPAEPPGAPSFHINALNKRSVNISWTPSQTGNPGTVFILKYRKQNTRHWVKRQPENSHQHWLVVEGLEQAAVYEIRVVAKNGNTFDSEETSSPVQPYILPRLKRRLLVPSFRIDHTHWESKNIIMLWLDQTTIDDVTTFYVKYRPEDEEQWQSLSDTPAYKPAIMNSLKQGILYELRVVVIRSQSGEAIESAIKKYRPGSEVQASAHAHPLNSTCSLTNHMSRIILIYWTIILIQMQRGYL